MSEIITNINYNDIQQLTERIILFQEDLYQKYSDYVPKAILKQYLPYETAITVNDDPDTYPFDLKLPEPPPLHTIDGFGLVADEQYFRLQVMPKKLQELIKTSSTYMQVIEKIDNNRREYRECIEWIRQQWYYRENGYWFWNNGIPTYIDGTHFYYLNYFKIELMGTYDLPMFNYRDRIWFIFAKYCFTTHEAPFFFRVQIEDATIEDPAEYWYFATEEEAKIYRGKNDLNYPVEKGFWLLTYPNRTCYGFNYPKHRREGATFKGAAWITELMSRLQKSDAVLLSKDGSSAEQAFKKKYKMPLEQMAFFFLPELGSSLQNKDGIIDFNKKTGADKSRTINKQEGLGSTIYPQTSSDELKSDGNRYYGVHGDEVGKGNPGQPYNCLKRHDVIIKTIAQRPEIHGMIINTSTADDTRGEFGRNYKELCKKSQWHERNYVEGLTESGLFNLFIPSYINLSVTMTDRYGNPLIDKLTKKQQRQTRQKHGAREFIENRLAQKVDDPDAYYHDMREFPTRYRHCFMASSEDAQFDVLAINNRISELDMMSKVPIRRGNFKWVESWGSDMVEFYDDPKGKFYVSHFPARPNNLIRHNGKLIGGNRDQFVAACDPFKFDETRKKRQSLGGGAVYMKRDKIIDPDTKPLEEWKTDRFVCTYAYKGTTEEFNEDMLMMTIFYGCELFPEMNDEIVYNYFKNNKYRNLLGFLYIGGIKEPKPGFFTQTEKKKMLFKLYKIKIETNIKHELHRDILQELADIEGMHDMKNYDLFAAGGGCLLSMYYSKDGLANSVKDADKKRDDSILAWIMREQRGDFVQT